MNLQQLKQLREAREKATQGEWKYAIDAPYVSLGDSNVILQVNSPDEARYIALLHNSIPEILDALEEAERMAEAGRELAEAVKDLDVKDFEATDRDGGYITGIVENNERITAKENVGYDFANRLWRLKKQSLLDTYNKTVNG